MSATVDNASREKRGQDVGKNIWTSLLSEVSSRSSSLRFSGKEKNIILLGDDLTGKTTIATKLQGKEDPHRGSALEYQYMEVQDDDGDEKAVCGIWILEGHRSYRSLLNFALPKERLSDTIVLITLDMSQPWNMMESLDNWTSVIREHIDHCKLSAQEMKSLEQKVIQAFQSYVEPSEGPIEGSSIVSQTTRTSSSREPDEEGLDDISTPLGENILTCNLGIQLIVVCTKCDLTEKLEKDYDYKEEHFDFIQHRLRSFCLKYGAALLYTSVKDNKNTEVLYKYLLHKLYGFPFNIAASVVDKDCVFVPAGWDTEKKISIITDNFTKVSVNDMFEDVITRPVVRKPLQEMKEITAKDEQAFLAEAQTLLSSPPVGAGAGVQRPGMPSRSMQNPVSKTPPGRPVSGVTGAVGSRAKQDPTKPTQSNERVLANFFNSLLNKKPGSPASPNKASDKTSADLARLQQHASNKQGITNRPGNSNKQSTDAS